MNIDGQLCFPGNPQQMPSGLREMPILDAKYYKCTYTKANP